VYDFIKLDCDTGVQLPSLPPKAFWVNHSKRSPRVAKMLLMGVYWFRPWLN